jgi:hypothetical protein
LFSRWPGGGGIIADVPEHVRVRARALLSMPGQDLFVADVVYDSFLDEAGGAEKARRLVRFALNQTATVEVEVELSPRGVSMEVRVEPKAPYRVTLLSVPELAVTYETDDDGVAGLSDVPAGLLSLRVDPNRDGLPLPFRTAWLVY